MRGTAMEPPGSTRTLQTGWAALGIQALSSAKSSPLSRHSGLQPWFAPSTYWGDLGGELDLARSVERSTGTNFRRPIRVYGDAMAPFLERSAVGNPHSERFVGRRASTAVEKAR